MVNVIDSTHYMGLESWVMSANGHPDFPVQNLPLGIFLPRRGPARAGVAIGNKILDLRVLYEMASPDSRTTLAPLAYAENLNGFLALGATARRRLRHFLPTSSPTRRHESCSNQERKRCFCMSHQSARLNSPCESATTRTSSPEYITQRMPHVADRFRAVCSQTTRTCRLRITVGLRRSARLVLRFCARSDSFA